MSSSFSFERYDRRTARNRGTFSYWVPLVFTVTLAAGGLAAWIWSARSDNESSGSSEDDELSYGEESVERRAAAAAGGARPPSYGVSEGVVREEAEHEEHSEYKESSEIREESSRGVSGQTQDGTFFDRVQGAIRRTPSPQQVFDIAGKRVAAGVAAAGAVMGSALSAIREEDRDYEDHERWSEEADTKNVTATSADSTSAVATNAEAFATSVREGPSTAASRSVSAATGSKRRTVAVAVSSESALGGLDEEEQGGYTTEQATLLSHLPPINPTTTNLLVLIYNPSGRPPSSQAGENKPSSLGSSYAALNTPAQTPGEELQSMDPQPYTPPTQDPALSSRDSHSELYDLLYKQAVRLVEKPTNVLSFTNPTGHIHMLKHLTPDTVYVVDSLAGDRGSNIEAIRGWVGQVVVVVGGDGSGLGGLIDTEDEGEGSVKGARRERWWESSDMVGLGKGVEVVDGVRFAEDWERRVGGRD